ncbi:UNKNOWN [Stylonychia lemnae]|uniref:Uncharacterized protein n=1 Tax=Stylonychia lemnae TaxID=5949 RepID=A0A078AUN8_STYLE|nr:UNKNOWN [Stylonychia lemnae]|eukprot:CDW84598.1 UNKNOWN [Stylonychia lemnae]
MGNTKSKKIKQSADNQSEPYKTQLKKKCNKQLKLKVMSYNRKLEKDYAKNMDTVEVKFSQVQILQEYSPFKQLLIYLETTLGQSQKDWAILLFEVVHKDFSKRDPQKVLNQANQFVFEFQSCNTRVFNKMIKRATSQDKQSKTILNVNQQKGSLQDIPSFRNQTSGQQLSSDGLVEIEFCDNTTQIDPMIQQSILTTIENIKTYKNCYEKQDTLKLQLKIIYKQMKTQNHPLNTIRSLFTTIINEELKSKFQLLDMQMEVNNYGNKGDSFQTQIFRQNSKMRVSDREELDVNIKNFKKEMLHQLHSVIKEFITMYKFAMCIYYKLDYQSYRQSQALFKLSNINLSFFSVEHQFTLGEQYQPDEERKVNFKTGRSVSQKRRNIQRPHSKSERAKNFRDEEDRNQQQIKSKKTESDINPHESQKVTTPYEKTIKLMNEFEKINSLIKKKMILKYSWNKLQKEVFEYWKERNKNISKEKLLINEDTRLCLVSYIIIQSQCAEVFLLVKELEPFIDQNRIEDALPLATFQNAIQVIMKDYECLSKNSEDQNKRRFSAMSKSLSQNKPNVLQSHISKTSQGLYSQIDEYLKTVQELRRRNVTQVIPDQQSIDDEHFFFFKYNLSKKQSTFAQSAKGNNFCGYFSPDNQRKFSMINQKRKDSINRSPLGNISTSFDCPKRKCS